MTWIHFKLAYNGKTHRFAPNAHGDQLFRAIKEQVAAIVHEEEYKLCWDDGESTMLLDSDDDFSDMIEFAKEVGKSSAKPPCIRLVVGVNETATEQPAASAAPVEQPEEESAAADEAAAEADSDAVVAALAQPSSDNAATIQSLLDSAEEKHRFAMDRLQMFVEEMKQDTNKRVKADSFSIRPARHLGLGGGDLTMAVHFCSLPDFSMWKTCVQAALFKLGICESSMRADKMPNYRDADVERYNISVTLEKKDLKPVLEQLKPVASRTHFKSVNVDESKPKFIRLLPEFLEGATVKNVSFSSYMRMALAMGESKKAKPTDFNLLLDLVQKLKPSELNYMREKATQEMFDFLEKAADLVNRMSVTSLAFGAKSKKEQPLPLSLLQNILSKKCNYLVISDTTSKVSLEQIEELAKFFDEKELKVSLALPTKEKRVDTTIGGYRAKFANIPAARGQNLLLVEHGEVEPKMEEMDEEDEMMAHMFY